MTAKARDLDDDCHRDAVFGGFAPFVATWLIAQTLRPAVSLQLLSDGNGFAQHHRFAGDPAARRSRAGEPRCEHAAFRVDHVRVGMTVGILELWRLLQELDPDTNVIEMGVF